MITEINVMSKEDFYSIKKDLKIFWGERYKIFVPLHHPIFFYSFGNTAFVIKDESDICAYLLGFYSQKEPKAYVHMVCVKKKYQHKGYALSLYKHFIGLAKKNGCTSISAITTPQNIDSIRFHKKLGMNLLGDTSKNGIPIVKDYAGVGEDRIVFEMDI